MWVGLRGWEAAICEEEGGVEVPREARRDWWGVWHSALGASLLPPAAVGKQTKVGDFQVSFCGFIGWWYEIGEWKQLEAG